MIEANSGHSMNVETLVGSWDGYITQHFLLFSVNSHWTPCLHDETHGHTTYMYAATLVLFCIFFHTYAIKGNIVDRYMVGAGTH